VGRRALGEDLRRLVARLGGAPEVHGVAEDVPAVRRPAPPAVAALAPPVAAAPVAHGLTPPGAALVARCHTGPAAVGRVAAVAWDPSAHRVAAPPARARVRAPGRLAAPGARPLAAPSPVARARPVGALGAAARTAAARLAAARARAVPPLPARAVLRTPRTPPAALRVARRARVPWAGIAPERLGRGWRRVLREHAHPAGDMRLVGVWGPLPLARVAGAVLEADGRLAVTLVPGRPGGPRGDVLLARHVPTGRLLRSDVPRPEPAARAAPGARRPRRPLH